jgi:hypothetical protein
MTTEGAAAGSRGEQAQRAVLALAGLAMGFSGAWMLMDAGGWYAATPGVAESGPLNEHFVQDIGAAFVAFAVGLLFAIRPLPARFALLSVAALFAVLHALIHVAEAISPGGRPLLGAEAGGILVPAAVAVAMVLWTWPRRGGAG